MALDYLGYNDPDKKMYIYNDNMEILEEHYIGECFVDFMEIDFSQFKVFYSDMEKLFDTTYSRRGAKHDQHRVSINKKNATNFFIKYPVLKQEVIKDTAKTLDHLFNKKSTINFNSQLLDQYFNFNNEPTPLDIINYESKDLSLEEFMQYDEFMRWLGYSLNSVHDLYKQTWNFIYRYRNPYIDNLNAIINHPYMMLSDDSDSDKSLVDELYPHILQNNYKDAYIFCFDVEYSPELNSLSAMERLFLFNALYPYNRIGYIDIKTEYKFTDPKNHLLIDTAYSDDDETSFLKWFAKANVVNNAVAQIRNMNIQQFQLYPTYKLPNTLDIEFHKMIEHNIKIKKCKNCGKYFILKGDYATEYCDRIVEGEKFTCKKLAAMRTRKSKVQNNPILKEYEKAYKRMYARQSSHKISAEDFRLWVEEASSKRDLAIAEYDRNHSDNIIQNFKEYLGNK